MVSVPQRYHILCKDEIQRKPNSSDCLANVRRETPSFVLHSSSLTDLFESRGCMFWNWSMMSYMADSGYTLRMNVCSKKKMHSGSHQCITSSLS